MKKILFLVFTLVFAVSAHAADTKIGYIDMNKALNQSDRGIKAVGMLEGMVQAKQSVIAEKESKIKEDLLKALNEGYARDFMKLIRKYFEALNEIHAEKDN